MNLLLDAGANPNAKNCEGEGPIFTAIRWDQPEVISILSHRGCEINGLNRQGLTPLAVAANFQSPGLVKALLDCDATREVSGVPDDQIDFLTSSKLPKTNNIELLNKPMTANNAQRNKKNVRVAETQQISELFDIVANNQSDQLSKRISEGIDPNSHANYTNETLLHAAVAYGASECVHLLIKAGADVNAQTALYQESPLHIAIQEGFFDIFHDLIRNGADIEIMNCEGEGPLFTAVKYDRVEMFRVLIRKGADVNKVNYGGLAPIHFSVMDSNEFLTDSLLYYGANPANGELNPYLYAFRAGDKTIANNLEIVAPTLATATKLSPEIFRVIKEDNVQALNKLIIKGFDLNLIDVLEGSPLHCATEHNSINCVKLLVENGANVNIRSIQRHETPLQIAIRKNYTELYDYFIGLNVDLSLRNKDVTYSIFWSFLLLFMKMPSFMQFVRTTRKF
ncbi:hypothetical protein TRFO_02337 [Tritrichomonas foetus]|uniref:Uncharacterized protein n=1 Tax=Tritrichomonas foetus TaxID=1144522 RepID=A0A1J4J385_9EUKA|nr:hypothetical protein TRFO_02337 [Tritrichomonas foetus]|eukprot:OHS93818.1 hypothetical protein TRFO_02337 [Tritrichomonas foetus]